MRHVPVLLAETVEFLQPGRGGFFVDCTVGLGGHARALLAASKHVRLLGIDRDREALAVAAKRLAEFGERVELIEADFEELAVVLRERGVEPGRGAAGILADLGVSSMQLETASRGFSFRRKGPLDMRMGRTGITAREIVNQYPEADLKRVIGEYGEERQAGRIARAIVSARKERPIESTEELRDLIYRAKRGRGRREGRVDPATRTFQALRIAVNRELEVLGPMIEQAVNMLEQDGRLVVISYHSLEDRVVKNTLRQLARGKIDEITGRPWAETRLVEVLTAKPVRPGDEEIALNPRARSARLRAARRI